MIVLVQKMVNWIIKTKTCAAAGALQVTAAGYVVELCGSGEVI